MGVTRFSERAEGVADRLSGFMAHLRLNGIPAGVQESETALGALNAIDALDMQQVRLALKAVCAHDAERCGRFDDLFDAYWVHGQRTRQSTRSADWSPRDAKRPSSMFDSAQTAPGAGKIEAPEEGDDEGPVAADGRGKLVASRTTNLSRVDLRELVTPDDIRRAEHVAADIARAIRDRRSRRRRMAVRGATLDLRRTIRASVSRGGEPLKLFKRKQPDRPVHLVVLLDVSGSMSVYARVFLSFLKGLVGNDQRTDAYLFHTRLICISDALRDGDTLRAVNRLTLLAEGFGGGTRIGANLKNFNEQYAMQRVNGRSVVMILSDGYDTDPPSVLSAALARLKKRGCRIVWLNPLKGWKSYEPVARGMAAAMPYLDLFAPANTLESLAALEGELGRI